MFKSWIFYLIMSHPKPWSYHADPLQQYYGDWLNEIRDYLELRYPPIVNRLINVFRYVDLHPVNNDTFSYEFASILRDIGSVFTSVLDSFVKGVGKEPKYLKYHDIRDYRDFLLEEFHDLTKISAILNVDFDQKLVFAFKGFNKKNVNSVWWRAYNNVKHSDIEHLKDGCLSNVIYAFSALTMLYESIIYIGSTAASPHTSPNRSRARKRLYPLLDITRDVIQIIHEIDIEKSKWKEFPLPTRARSNLLK